MKDKDKQTLLDTMHFVKQAMEAWNDFPSTEPAWYPFIYSNLEEVFEHLEWQYDKINTEI